ncbi:MAG: phosphoribosylanthranilate isomerase, partial [Prevotella sp.]|nr:phosphoribosylanthranilate isomerase [Prevotella sp.]
MIIKVCGMRDGQNIRAVENLHPDMMGFICWDKSKRNVYSKPDYLPAVCRVGVFVDPTIEEVLDKVRMLGLNRVQLHGSESPEMCDAVHLATALPITKVFSVNGKTDILKYHEYEDLAAVDLFLFDTKCKTVGGSGEQFDWDVLHYYDGKKPFLLAGGIGPGDEQRVLNYRHPRFAGIDLNSRFETAPGIKDSKQLDKFINIIRHEQNK